MVNEVHRLLAHGFEIELLFHRHRRGFDPVAIFPVARDRGHFADVDFGIEVGREMLAMIAAVAIENVERVDTLEMMLPEPGGEDAGHPGVEADRKSTRLNSSH